VTLVVGIDTETTGLGANDPEGPRPDGIVQIGIAWRDRRRELQTWQATCNPGAEFLADGRADQALRVNGLTIGEVLAAPPARKVPSELRSRLVDLEKIGGGIELRAFNAPFDQGFLSVPPWIVSHPWGPCLMLEAVEKFGSPTGRMPLWRALAEARIEQGAGAHTAGADARSALLLHEFLRPEAPSSRRPTSLSSFG
jgi:DNA polymerase III epsilon subunit-like protein